MQLSLSLSKTEFLVGEPIAAWIELSNGHDRPILAHRDFHWRVAGGSGFGDGYPYLSLLLSRDHKSERYHPYGMPDAQREPPRRAWINPGERLRTKELILGLGEGGQLLASPGTVEITAEFRDIGFGKEAIKSHSVRITIREPKGRDATVLAWLRRHGYLQYLGYIYFVSGSFNDVDIQSIRSLRQPTPTVYAPYASFGFGQMLFYRKRYQEAIDAFKLVVEDHPKSPVVEDAMLLVGESYLLLQKQAEAERWYREVIKRYPRTPASDYAENRLKELARRVGAPLSWVGRHGGSEAMAVARPRGARSSRPFRAYHAAHVECGGLPPLSKAAGSCRTPEPSRRVAACSHAIRLATLRVCGARTLHGVRWHGQAMATAWPLGPRLSRSLTACYPTDRQRDGLPVRSPHGPQGKNWRWVLDGCEQVAMVVVRFRLFDVASCPKPLRSQEKSRQPGSDRSFQGRIGHVDRHSRAKMGRGGVNGQPSSVPAG